MQTFQQNSFYRAIVMEFNKEHTNFFILTIVRCDKKASEFHHFLHAAWGDDIISERQVRRFVQEMREGERDSIAPKVGSGWPRTSVTPDNIVTIRELIENDPHLSKSANSSITD